MDYKQLGLQILKLAGGSENISKLTHCATRLRFEFCDSSRVQEEAIKGLPGVITYSHKRTYSQSVKKYLLHDRYHAIVYGRTCDYLNLKGRTIYDFDRV